MEGGQVGEGGLGVAGQGGGADGWGGAERGDGRQPASVHSCREGRKAAAVPPPQLPPAFKNGRVNRRIQRQRRTVSVEKQGWGRRVRTAGTKQQPSNPPPPPPPNASNHRPRQKKAHAAGRPRCTTRRERGSEGEKKKKNGRPPTDSHRSPHHGHHNRHVPVRAGRRVGTAGVAPSRGAGGFLPPPSPPPD